MKPLQLLRCCVWFLAMVGGVALTAPTQAEDVTIYHSNNARIMKTALETMRRIEPSLKVAQVRASTGVLMRRIQSEAAQPLGDVVWGAGIGTLLAYKQGFEPYESPARAAIAPEFRGEFNFWTGSNIQVMVIMVNETQLNGDAPPASWADLFDPKWKGRLIIGDPTVSSSAYSQLYGLYELFGDEGFARLRANAEGGRGPEQVYRSVASGEYALGITMEYAAHGYVARGQKEIKLVYPSEGVFLAVEGVSIIKNPRQGVSVAHKVHDLLLSKAVQQAELQENFRRPTRADIKVSDFADLPETSELKIYAIDPLKAAARYDEVIAAWRAAGQ